MLVKTVRRRRRRRQTMSPRFGCSNVALEIGLIRMTLDVLKDYEREEFQKKVKK